MKPDAVKTWPKTLAVDFDGVIHWYRKGWHDGSVYDDPFPGARECLQRLIDQGHKILIYSTRLMDRIVNGETSPSQLEEVKAWWKKHNMPEDVKFWTEPGKPLAFVYIDDRALSHVSWPLTMSILDARLALEKK